MLHRWKVQTNDGWVVRTCEKCGREEHLLMAPGLGVCFRAALVDVGNRWICPVGDERPNPIAKSPTSSQVAALTDATTIGLVAIVVALLWMWAAP